MSYKKQSIPKALKIAVWNKYFGEDVGKAKCLCCDITDITQMKFHTGHVVAEAKGGELNIDNLRPICESCNKSMGTRNMDDFQKIIRAKSFLFNGDNIKFKNNIFIINGNTSELDIITQEDKKEKEEIIQCYYHNTYDCDLKSEMVKIWMKSKSASPKFRSVCKRCSKYLINENLADIVEND